jgi:hypothetical protein
VLCAIVRGEDRGPQGVTREGSQKFCISSRARVLSEFETGLSTLSWRCRRALCRELRYSIGIKGGLLGLLKAAMSWFHPHRVDKIRAHARAFSRTSELIDMHAPSPIYCQLIHTKCSCVRKNGRVSEMCSSHAMSDSRTESEPPSVCKTTRES